MTGKVYFVAAPGRIKVGFTRQPNKRLGQLKANDLEEITTIAVIDGTLALEKRIHQLLEAHCIRGEWFRDCDAVREVLNDVLAGRITAEEAAKPRAAFVDVPDDVPIPEIPEISRMFGHEPGRLDAALARLEIARAKRILAENTLALLLAGTEAPEGSREGIAATSKEAAR